MFVEGLVFKITPLGVAPFGLLGVGLGVETLRGDDFGEGLDDLTELAFDRALELLDDFVDDRELRDELLLDELLRLAIIYPSFLQ